MVKDYIAKLHINNSNGDFYRTLYTSWSGNRDFNKNSKTQIRVLINSFILTEEDEYNIDNYGYALQVYECKEIYLLERGKNDKDILSQG